MFARFLIPITPLLYLFFERLFLSSGMKKSLYAFIVIASAVFTQFQHDPFSSGLPLLQSITDEYRVYTPERRKSYREFSMYLKKSLRNLDPVIAFKGGNAGMIYYLDISTAIESETGLTDRFIASQNLRERGRIGHEKAAPLEYLEERNVSFILGTMPPDRDFGYNGLSIEGFPGKIEILTWQPEIMEPLSKYPEFTFADFPSYLESREQVSKSDMERFQRYYFNHADDKERFTRIQNRIR